jgi:hypothetical protein
MPHGIAASGAAMVLLFAMVMVAGETAAAPITIDDFQTPLSVSGLVSGTAGLVEDEIYFSDGIVPAGSIFAERGQFGLLSLAGTDADPSPVFSGAVAVASGTATIAIGRTTVAGRSYQSELNVVGINWTTGTTGSPIPVDLTAGGNTSLAFDVTSFTKSESFDIGGGLLLRLLDADASEAFNVILATDLGVGPWSIELAEFGPGIDLTNIVEVSISLAAQRFGFDSAYDASVSITNVRLVPEPRPVGWSAVALAAAAVWRRRRLAG